MFRSSPPVVFSKKGAAKIRSKTTGEQSCRSAISTKPLCNFIEITPAHGCTPEKYTRRNLSLGKHLWETAPVPKL